MKLLYSSIIVLSVFIATVAFMLESDKDSYELVWVDDFDGNQLDKTKWSPIIGDGCPDLCGWGNNELQYYLDNRQNVRVEDGKLLIQAHKKPMKNRAFTSAKLVTKNKMDLKYGRIEIRAILPDAMGTWPAIWMLPTITERERKWPQDGEIDIVEHVGYNPGMVYGAIHTEKYNGMIGTHKPDSIYITSSNTEFHNYSVEWTDESITWFVDGNKYHHLSKGEDDIDGWPFNQFDYHLIMNLAVGGNWGGKYGVAENAWPQTLIIDYVKYYRPANLN